MNSTQQKMPLNQALMIAGAIGLLALILLKIVGGFSFWAAFFLGLIVAIAVLIFLVMKFGANAGAAQTGSGQGAQAVPAPSKPEPAAASAAPKAAPVVVAPPAAAKPAAVGNTSAASPKKTKTPTQASVAKSEVDMSEDFDKDGKIEGTAEGSKPATLSAARDGKPDNLKEIKGVGPAMEKLLNSLGFYHFDQVAGWSADEVAWVNANLGGFKGRATRDNWVAQAKILAAGGETEFSARVDKGQVY